MLYDRPNYFGILDWYFGPIEVQGIECYLTSISVSGFIAAGWGHVRKGVMTSDLNPDIVIKSLYQVEWTFQSRVIQSQILC